MACRKCELPLSPTFRWNARMPIFMQFLVVMLAATCGWILLTSAYTPSQGRIISNWDFDVSQADHSVEDPEGNLKIAQSQATQVFSHLSLPKSDRSSFGRLALNLEFPAMLSKGDFITATRKVCMSHGSALAFYISTPFKRLEVSGAFTLHLLQNGRELWSIKLPAAEQPLAYEVPLPDGERCFDLEFKLVSRTAIKSESWRRASRVEIIFPRLNRVD